jgi:hypothetical protein
MSTISTKVLQSNGLWKPLHQVKIGDKVMNMYGKPVAVSGIKNFKVKQNSSLINIKHDNWYVNVIVKDDTEILVWNSQAKHPQWIQADYYSLNNEQTLLMPLRMNWELPASFDISYKNNIVKPSYYLGFILGAFLKIGFQHHHLTSFHTDTSSKEFVDTLRDYIDYVFGIKLTNDGSTFFYDIQYNDQDFYRIFELFGQYNKHFPIEYLCSDLEYIKGMHFGMLSSGKNDQQVHQTPQLKELFYWTSHIMGKASYYGQLKFVFQGEEVLASRSTLYTVERRPVELISLETECPSQTYVLNNMIVRS